MEKKGSTETGSRKSDSVYIAMDWNVLKDITNVENRVKCLKLAVKKKRSSHKCVDTELQERTTV